MDIVIGWGVFIVGFLGGCLWRGRARDDVPEEVVRWRVMVLGAIPSKRRQRERETRELARQRLFASDVARLESDSQRLPA